MRALLIIPMKFIVFEVLYLINYSIGINAVLNVTHFSTHKEIHYIFGKSCYCSLMRQQRITITKTLSVVFFINWPIKKLMVQSTVL